MSRQAGQRQGASGLERGMTQGLSSHQHRSPEDKPPQGNAWLQRAHVFCSILDHPESGEWLLNLRIDAPLP